MREVTVSKGRQCVFPEVSRTYTFGSSGTSGGFMFSKHLKDIALNEENVDWSKQVRAAALGAWRVLGGSEAWRATVQHHGTANGAHTHTHTYTHTQSPCQPLHHTP
jgi:uncharacterized protein YgiB involved in biofilm formation